MRRTSLPLLLSIFIGILLPKLDGYQNIFLYAGAVFLFLSGLELNLKGLKNNFGLLFGLALGAFLPPFLTGYACGILFPKMFPSPVEISVQVTAYIIGLAMSVSAVPVIIKILQELKILGTALGRNIIMTATLCDVAAWLLFLPLLPASAQSSWILSHLTLLLFFIGMAVSFFADKLMNKQIENFYWLKGINTWLVAPLFFIGVGQKLNFTDGINLPQIVLIFILGSISKIGGVLLAGRLMKLPMRDNKIIAVALNARGAMEIILASLALQAGLIDKNLFTSLIVLALGTTIAIKPILKKLLRQPI